MNEPTEILARLRAARSAIQRASAAFDADGEIDMRTVEREVDLAAAAATHSTDHNRAEARSALINLAADLTDLQAKIRVESRKTADALGRTSVGQRAAAAYNRRG